MASDAAKPSTQNWADCSEDFACDDSFFAQSPGLGPASPHMKGKPPPIGQPSRGPGDVQVSFDTHALQGRIDEANRTLGLSNPVPLAPPFFAYITHISPELVQEDIEEFLFQYKQLDASAKLGIDWNDAGKSGLGYHEMYIEFDSLKPFLDLLFMNGEDIMGMAIKVDVYLVPQEAPVAQPPPRASPPQQQRPAVVQQQQPTQRAWQPKGDKESVEKAAAKPRRKAIDPFGGAPSRSPQTGSPPDSKSGGRFNFKGSSGKKFEQRALPQRSSGGDPFGGAPPRRKMTDPAPQPEQNGQSWRNRNGPRSNGSASPTSSQSSPHQRPSTKGQSPFGDAKPRDGPKFDDADEDNSPTGDNNGIQIRRSSSGGKRGGSGGMRQGFGTRSQPARDMTPSRAPVRDSFSRPGSKPSGFPQRGQPDPAPKKKFARAGADDGDDDFAADGTYKGPKDAPAARQGGGGFNSRNFSNNRQGGQQGGPGGRTWERNSRGGGGGGGNFNRGNMSRGGGGGGGGPANRYNAPRGGGRGGDRGGGGGFQNRRGGGRGGMSPRGARGGLSPRGQMRGRGGPGRGGRGGNDGARWASVDSWRKPTRQPKQVASTDGDGFKSNSTRKARRRPGPGRNMNNMNGGGADTEPRPQQTAPTQPMRRKGGKKKIAKKTNLNNGFGALMMSDDSDE